MTICRRDFMKGAAATAGLAAVSSPYQVLGQSDGSVMDYIRSNFQYDSNNQYFSDSAIATAKDELNFKSQAVIDTLEAFKEFSDLSLIRADDLPGLDHMTQLGASAAGDMERIYDHIGTRLPHEMMRGWLANQLFDDGKYSLQVNSLGQWYNGPKQLSDYVERLNVQFLYPDLLDLAFWNIPNMQIQPRSVDLDVNFVEELDRLAQQEQNGLQVKDQPLLDRRYLYEYLLATGQEDRLFSRDSLEQTYQDIMWERQSATRSDRQQEIRKAQQNGINDIAQAYSHTADQLSSTSLLYVQLADQLLTDESLTELKDHVLNDWRDKSTEWGGRVQIENDRLKFLHDPVRKKEGDGQYFPGYEDEILPEFSTWHAHAENINSPWPGPSSGDFQSLAAGNGAPKFLITSLGRRGNTLRMNVDLYQSTTDCSTVAPTGFCPWGGEEYLDTYVVDLGIFEA